MKMELINNDIFKHCFESVSRIVDEVTCDVDSEGFHMEAIDRSHICFVSLNLTYDLFDTFECEAPERLCLDTNEFMQILKRMKKNDVLGLSVDENNLIINLMGEVEKTFKIRLIDIDYDAPKSPNLELPVGVEMESNLLKDALGDMDLFGDSLTIEIDTDYVYIYTNGEFGDANFKYLHGETGITENVKSSYSIPKLKDIFSASKFSDTVKIMLGNDMPVKFEFHTIGEDGILGFLLAPKINQEE